MTKFDCVMIGLFSGIIVGGALSTYAGYSQSKQPIPRMCEVACKNTVEQRIKPMYPVGTFEHEAKWTE